MLKIDHTHSFIAKWNESNSNLSIDRGGHLEKTIRKALRFIFYIPNSLIATCFNPRGESPFYSGMCRLDNRFYFNKEIITPDQVSLAATVHIIDSATPATPTVLLFNPLGANHDVHDDLKLNLLKKNCNVITFDYRGLGATRRAEDLVIDGESVYQYAIDELGVEKDKIHFYGFSLGGAISAQVKALHPESKGKYVGDRPFKSIYHIITENCCIERLGPALKKITSLISAIFIAMPVYLLGWEWDGKRAVTLMNGDKRVVYHPNDYLVPFKASLACDCPENELIQLDRNESGLSTHFSPLTKKITSKGTNALSEVTDFLSS